MIFRTNLLKREIETCAKNLEPLGFSSFHKNGVDWVLVRGGLVFRFYMCSEMSGLPVLAHFYGIHPLFVPTPLNLGKTATSFEGAYSREVLARIPPITDVEFSSGISESQKAVEAFFLPLVERIQTPADAYSYHKDQFKLYCEKWDDLADDHAQAVSSDLIDEALFFEDKQIFPQCKAAIDNYLLPQLDRILDTERTINSLSRNPAAKKQVSNAKKGAKTKEHLLLCLDVIEGKQREAFTKELLDLAKRNEQMINRHFLNWRDS